MIVTQERKGSPKMGQRPEYPYNCFPKEQVSLAGSISHFIRRMKAEAGTRPAPANAEA